MDSPCVQQQDPNRHSRIRGLDRGRVGKSMKGFKTRTAQQGKKKMLHLVAQCRSFSNNWNVVSQVKSSTLMLASGIVSRTEEVCLLFHSEETTTLRGMKALYSSC